MKNKFIILLLIVFQNPIWAEAQSDDFLISLKKISAIINRHDSLLWGLKFNPDLIFIDVDDNRMIFASLESGTAFIHDKIAWNNAVGLANSIVMYKDKRYVTINYRSYCELSFEEKAKLVAHETFHLYQDSLGIKMTTSNNQHLDTPIGRSLLRIEFEALKNALLGSVNALHEAICIREYRQSLYPENNEIAFELNEGLAEYTAIKMSIDSINTYLVRALSCKFDKGYTNSFAYITGAVYAFFLDSFYPAWKNDLNRVKGLTFLIPKSNIRPNNVIALIKEKYHYKDIEFEEMKYMQDTDKYKNLLIEEQEKFLIKNNGIRIIFNPNDRVIPIDDNSVLLKNVEIKSDWGILHVRDGLIRMNDWSSFYLLPPTSVEKDVVQGCDYTLYLSALWSIYKENNTWIIKKE